MQVKLDYGRTGLTVTVPDDLRPAIVDPPKGHPLPQPEAAVEEALCRPMGAAPLHDVARGR
jgi:hypothetical protein